MIWLFRSVRWVLGGIIITLDRITAPKPIIRELNHQNEIDSETAAMALYQFNMCPFCVMTRRTMRQLNLKIELRDARNDEQWNTELIQQGGKYQVPCLRIENDGDVIWMYDSGDIKKYLNQRFS